MTPVAAPCLRLPPLRFTSLPTRFPFAAHWRTTVPGYPDVSRAYSSRPASGFPRHGLRTRSPDTCCHPHRLPCNFRVLPARVLPNRWHPKCRNLYTAPGLLRSTSVHGKVNPYAFAWLPSRTRLLHRCRAVRSAPRTMSVCHPAICRNPGTSSIPRGTPSWHRFRFFRTVPKFSGFPRSPTAPVPTRWT